MKRIVTIQDVSCIGKCSLTVALPIISSMGIECAIIPTAVLSTHTMFKGFTFRDLTSDIEPIAEHWKKEKFNFDAIYTGYLGSIDQLDIVSKFIDDFKKKETIVFIDPVMADNGKLYPGFTDEFVENMKKLVAKADIVVPNLTEASFLTGCEYKSEGYDEKYIKDILEKLCAIGAKKAFLTGVSFKKGELGVLGLDKESGKYTQYYHKQIPVSFHGTGDIFSSTFIASLVRCGDMLKAIKDACSFTVASIEKTLENKDHVNYGVEFEKVLESGLLNK